MGGCSSKGGSELDEGLAKQFKFAEHIRNHTAPGPPGNTRKIGAGNRDLPWALSGSLGSSGRWRSGHRRAFSGRVPVAGILARPQAPWRCGRGHTGRRHRPQQAAGKNSGSRLPQSTGGGGVRWSRFAQSPATGWVSSGNLTRRIGKPGTSRSIVTDVGISGRAAAAPNRPRARPFPGRHCKPHCGTPGDAAEVMRLWRFFGGEPGDSQPFSTQPARYSLERSALAASSLVIFPAAES